MDPNDRARALAAMRDPALHAREHVRRLSRVPDLSPEEEAILRLPCFAALGWNEPSCYTPAERALVHALARHAGLLASPPVIDIAKCGVAEVCLAHLEPEPCPTCAAYRAAGL